jgi:hypothetical protein
LGYYPHCSSTLIGGNICVGPFWSKSRFEFAVFGELEVIWWWKGAEMEVKEINAKNIKMVGFYFG